MEATVKLTRQDYFYKIPKIWLTVLSPREAFILAIVKEFESSGAKCYLSRREFGARLNESPASVERTIQDLLAKGLLVAVRNGRLRYLFSDLSTAFPQAEE